MVLGFAAGQLSLFKPVATDNQLWFVYFAIGLFPTWALQALRDRARTAFGRDEEGLFVTTAFAAPLTWR
jgi:hypothetical protein